MILSEIENTQAGDIITTDPDVTREPVAVLDVPADGGRRRGRAARRHHRAAQRGSPDQPSGALRRTDRSCPTGSISATRSAACWRSSRAPNNLSALLFIDLDQFKQVNDTLGHPCGDQLLCAVADRLREMLRPEDFVARFGGDEFVVFQQNIHSTDDAAGLARRIVERLSERYKIDNHLVEIGASVGIAMTVARRQRRYAAQERRHGAVPRQGRRPRHLLLLPRRDGADRRSAPHPRTRPAQGAGQRGVRAVLPAAGQSQIRHGSRPARRCCAGIIRCAARCRRSTSFRSPRTWA